MGYTHTELECEAPGTPEPSPYSVGRSREDIYDSFHKGNPCSPITEAERRRLDSCPDPTSFGDNHQETERFDMTEGHKLSAVDAESSSTLLTYGLILAGGVMAGYFFRRCLRQRKEEEPLLPSP